MRTAKYFQVVADDKIKCFLCPHECLVAPDKRGTCQGRINQAGVLKSENYGQVSSMGIDPVEKKPLYHFYPGNEILSVGTFGCNFRCQFCQNWQISQEKPELREIMPAELVRLAQDRKALGIAYTYSEPSIWYEYILDCSILAHEHNLKNVLVTNGYLNKEPLVELMPYLDGVNIDLKAFNNDFYQKVCGGKLQPVLDNIKLMAGEKEIELELTTLIIPELNDDKAELQEMFSWIRDLRPDIPLHLSRYFPRYKLNKPATAVEEMEYIYQLAREYLEYVYLGNVRLKNSSNTICPECDETVIIRNGYTVQNKLRGNNCPVCGHEISGQF